MKFLRKKKIFLRKKKIRKYCSVNEISEEEEDISEEEEDKEVLFR